MHQRPLAEIAKPSTKLGTTADYQHEAHFDFWPVYAGLRFYLHKRITKKNSSPQVVAKDFGDAQIHGRTLRAIELAQVMRLVSTAAIRPPLLDMFSEHEIPMWPTYDVQLHFDSQDILAEATKRPHSKLAVYLNGIMGAHQEITEE
jgi:hypothetical protein